ncbi:hypothetical protein ACL02S_05510 [Nocardia sp. 004]|uniref:hypothetical protein n=1 Tax=Nocardia sp. 004 TaxID=3385978 RepID=UPI0039A00C5D
MTSLLGVVIGGEAAQRVAQGTGTLCDVVLAAWATDVDPAEAVVQYAEVVVAAGSFRDGGERCA